MDPIAALDQQLLTQYQAATAKSRAWHQRAVQVMPGGDTRTGTFHLPYPLFVSKGQGCRLWDADGNEYLDFLNNFTSLLHGHAHPDVTKALVDQVARGTVHGTANELQVLLAETLVRRVPSVERLRFCNSGTEATLFALRAAKAFTGRSKIMKMAGGYHGSHDQVAVAMAPPFDTKPALGMSPGAVSEVILGSFNDLDHTAEVIRRHQHELACVIVEPMMGSSGAIPADREFLRGLRQVTEEAGVLLILDEIITFRLGYGGCQEHYGIRPDLTTFGKIIGGGLPIGAFGGRADVMANYDPTRPGAIVHSGTYNGHAAAMAAGLATLERYDRPAVAALNQAGDDHREQLNRLLEQSGVEARVTGFGSVMQLHFLTQPIRTAADTARGDRRLLRLMHLALLTRGVFSASRQMYVLSTAMDAGVLEEFRRRFGAGLEMIAAATAGSLAVR
jgi:glutamate-1-semialdehyde 2,1-aminomutase